MTVKIRSNVQHDSREGGVEVKIDVDKVNDVFKLDGFDLVIDGNRIIQCPCDPRGCRFKRLSIIGFGPVCDGVEGVTFNFPKGEKEVPGSLWCKERRP